MLKNKLYISLSLFVILCFTDFAETAQPKAKQDLITGAIANLKTEDFYYENFWNRIYTFGNWHIDGNRVQIFNKMQLPVTAYLFSYSSYNNVDIKFFAKDDDYFQINEKEYSPTYSIVYYISHSQYIEFNVFRKKGGENILSGFETKKVKEFMKILFQP